MNAAFGTSKGGPAGVRKRQNGAVLLEVVLALVLFVAAAAVISGGLHASLETVDRLKLNAHAADLAVSVISELQMGARSADLTGPEPFEEPFDSWTWELVISAVETAESTSEAVPMSKVEVVIRHAELPVVYRLTQVVRLGAAQSLEVGSDAGSTF